jgi:type II secretory pathway component PulM
MKVLLTAVNFVTLPVWLAQEVELQHVSVALAMLTYLGLPVYVTLDMVAQCSAAPYAILPVLVAQDQAQMPA